MGRIFLGKPLHWGLIVVLIVVGWYLGHQKTHVIWFNLFTALLLVLSAAVVIAVILTTKPHETVTRDPLEPEQD